MKVIIIEDDAKINNSKASKSEQLYNKLIKQGVEVHIVESNPLFVGKSFTKKDKKKYFIGQ